MTKHDDKGKENERRVAERTHQRLLYSRYKEHPSIKHGLISQGLGGSGRPTFPFATCMKTTKLHTTFSISDDLAPRNRMQILNEVSYERPNEILHMIITID